jgi:hypothetical protein
LEGIEKEGTEGRDRGGRGRSTVEERSMGETEERGKERKTRGRK